MNKTTIFLFLQLSLVWNLSLAAEQEEFCMSCHQYPGLVRDEVEFLGEPFGAKYHPLSRLTYKPDSILSRISPFPIQQGQYSKALMNTWDTAGAVKVCSARTCLDEDEKALEVSHYHRDVVKIERTAACEECHANSRLLDFRAPGFSQARCETLLSLPIVNIIKQYCVSGDGGSYPHLPHQGSDHWLGRN